MERASILENEATARATELDLLARSRRHSERTAIVATEGTFTYRDLCAASRKVASALLHGTADLAEKRVAFLIPASFNFVAVLWGIWQAGGIAVPLAVSHPSAELEYVIADADADIVVASLEFAPALRPFAEKLARRFYLTTELFSSLDARLPRIAAQRRGLMLYTSGTTNKPKGVVTTHHNIAAQVTMLIAAWEWRANDRILLALPLHHVHGLLNVLTCALWAGATCEMLPQFDAKAVWEKFLTGHCTLFMAVPTIYVKLIAEWESSSKEEQAAMSAACARMRLMVSGSAALPISVLEKWRAISGHVLLERYGMTETGMILSNPLHGERKPGFVGMPLPNVEVRLVDEHDQPVADGHPGEIQVRGPSVFLEYWRKPEATAAAFCGNWFRTGDIAIFENDSYRILGRNTIDIIKTGGYKVSALEIEETLREHAAIAECAVVGVPDLKWGERVCAVLVLKTGSTLTLEELRQWCKDRLAIYKIPSRLLIVETLPRNAMGKVMKPEVKRLLLLQSQSEGSLKF